MTLEPGTKLGPYEIVGPLGAGGMGEVYRAKDTRLGREVAVKVLPFAVSEDEGLRARFEREARSVAALNHPHICALYDVGREGERDYLVMELLEGETLAARLERGALPTNEVLKLGAQIADALDRAHRQGLVHRDLKPGNIMLTRQGAKLLDFGLARPTTPAAGTPGSSVFGGTRASTPMGPTMTGPLTMAGAIVGTFQYMAPEQLEGKDADARSDLWAFGAVLYQMATGRPAFMGASQASLIASILKEQPRPIAELVPVAPPALDRLVQACLAKDPEERIQTAHDVKLQLRWIEEGGSQAGVPAPVAAARRRHERLAWIVAAIGMLAAGALGTVLVLQPKPVRRTVRFIVEAPPGAQSMSWPRLSPDGSMLAFMSRDSAGTSQIWIRPLSATRAYPLGGTEGSARPFWSPDSKELAWFSEGKLRKVGVGGGNVQTLGEAPGASDGSWSANGLIIFDGASGDTLRTIPATGGPITAATSLDAGMRESQHMWPAVLPDGKRFLFQSGRVGTAKSLLRLGRFGSVQSTFIDSLDSRAEFLAPSHLVYVDGEIVVARRFDLGSGKLTGNPIVVGEAAGTTTNTQAFSVATNGTIAFQSTGAGSRNIVARYDRTGKLLGRIGEPCLVNSMGVSPDARRLCLAIADPRSIKRDLWIEDLVRGTRTRLTFDPGNDMWPVWSPDGDSIAFSSDRGGTFRIMIKAASGLGEERLVPGQDQGNTGPIQWSADGNWILGQELELADGSWRAIAIPIREAGASPLRVEPMAANQQTPKLSPDGRFIALDSNESGRYEVYVQTFPRTLGRWQVSVQGGTNAWWVDGGAALQFRSNSGDFMRATFAVGPDGVPRIGTPTPLFKSAGPLLSPSTNIPVRDGAELLSIEPAGLESRRVSPIIVVLDAAAELPK